MKKHTEAGDVKVLISVACFDSMFERLINKSGARR